MKNRTIRDLAMIGVFAALVFAASWIQITIPTPIDNTRLHLGNVACLLSGFVLGPVPGGLAAGLGSMFFDFSNPLFVKDAPLTFLMKFAMAFVCGLIAKDGRSLRRNVAAAVCGAGLYVVLYLCKNFIENYFFLRAEPETVKIMLVTKGTVSSINAVIAVIAAVPLSAAVKKAMLATQQRAG